MHRTPTPPVTGLLIALALGCSARGGGGGFIDPDASTGVDTATTADSTASTMDSGAAPSDAGKPLPDAGPTDDLAAPPVDRVDPPADRGDPPMDLGTPPRCGDGLCNGAENCMTCASDCGACPPACGDGTCGGGETCASCPPDCGACPARCGDGSCNGGETCTTCMADCGACAPRCGDGTCNGSETCTTCAADCGACPANCQAITSCAACTADTRCGWCATDSQCLPGTASGPSVSSLCTIFGGWTRSASLCPAPDAGPRDAGTVDAGPVNITRACTTGTAARDGLEAECGWALGQTYTCTPGTTVVVGCTGGAVIGCAASLGACSGDPMIRTCAGSGQCSYAGRLMPVEVTGYSEDDACDRCPLARYTCPSAGRVSVYQRAFYLSRDAGATSCTVSRL